MKGRNEGNSYQINTLQEKFTSLRIFRYFTEWRPFLGRSSHILLNGRPSELHFDNLRLLSTPLDSAQDCQNRLARFE